MKTIECPECCGVGTIPEQFEPMPGGNMPGDDLMGQSIRVNIKCRICNGEKTIPVPADYEPCGECGFDHCYEWQESYQAHHITEETLVT